VHGKIIVIIRAQKRWEKRCGIQNI